MLKVGDRVPDFSINAEYGPGFSNEDIQGKRAVLYFYPKDDTPGCTKEACGFRDQLPQFGNLGVPVYGISADDEKSHIRFARKFGLNFPLVADPERHILDAFGTWVEKSMYGKKYFGVARSTFVISPQGTIEKVWEQVNPETHPAEVLAYLSSQKPIAGKGVAQAKTAAGKAPARPPAAKAAKGKPPAPAASGKAKPMKAKPPTKAQSQTAKAKPKAATKRKPATLPKAGKKAARKAVAPKKPAKAAKAVRKPAASVKKPIKKAVARKQSAAPQNAKKAASGKKGKR